MDSSRAAPAIAARRPSLLVYLREITFVLAAYAVYYQVRGISATREGDALRNAQSLIDLEKNLGIFEELAVQAWVLPHQAVVNLTNLVYVYTLFPLLLPTAIGLFIWRPRVYELARDAFFISGAIAAAFYVFVPTAPPRLLDIGFVDTVMNGGSGLIPAYQSLPGVNQFAALPSMHVGWNLLIAIVLFRAAGRGRPRLLFFLLPAAMTFATVATGNHFFLDAVLGVIVAAAGYGAALIIDRYRERRAVSRA